MTPRPPAPLPRLDHHTLERYEGIWLGIATILSVLLFVGVIVSFVSGTYSAIGGGGGHHLPGVDNGRLDPKAIAATPFAQPGLRERPDGTLEAFVVAKAFAFDPPVLRVPAGRRITFHLTSLDVMHGFAVEHTTINASVVPGQVTSFDVTFSKMGSLNAVCNEYCGIGHHNMLSRVIVTDPATRSAAPTSTPSATSTPAGDSP